MKKIVSLSLVCTAMILNASETTLEDISVVEKVNMKTVKDVSANQIKSADLAEALTKKIPSISLVRRSGIANDIILRGAKKDNINVLIDNSKIYGACPNRMDPTTSHVLTNNIESVEVIEGPYDVENFGTLSGAVKIKTKQPSQDFKGEVNLNVGSFSYRKLSTTIQGGNKRVKLLISASTEESDPYKDGNGDNFKEQQKKHGVPTSNQYSSEADNKKAYEKKTLLTKALVNIDDSSELALSYTLNRSDEVMYPNTPMDGDYDDSDIYTISYTKRDLGKYSKELKAQYYYSKVDHPMSVKLRNSSTMMKEMTNHMKSSIWGAKVKNTMNLNDSLLTLGLDTSIRNWKGRKFNNDLSVNMTSLPSTDTTNKAIFAKHESSFGNIDLEVGTRFDNTKIDTDSSTKKDNKYNSLNGHIFAVINANDTTKYFAGIGKSSRVPDARELYYSGSGNEDLDDTKNYELDLGFQKNYENSMLKTKVFYSVLKDYVYNNNGTTFENIDAKIYGIELSGLYAINDEFTLDYGASYLKGKKDDSLAGQSDKDMAEIPPLKANVSLSYENNKSKFTTQVLAVKSWSDYDSDNGEQELPGYAVVNVKYDYMVNKHFELAAGIDNIFDKTYASTNTYNDIKYIGSGDTELINEPGRYLYTNLKFKF